jgi:FkbM family methyltransferase
MIKEIAFKNIKALVREGTSDEFVVSEVFSGEYNKLHITSDDTVVDFGLNIGMFTLFALSKGAKKIYSYEAEKSNYELATQNLALNEIAPERYNLFNKAVVGNDDAERIFWINEKKNKGAHSLIHKRGRSTMVVEAININTVFESCKPTVVKMDIEGGEYECLKAVKSFDGIRELILEFHHTHLNDTKTHEKYNEILALLRSQFANVQARADTKEAWVNIIYCSR